MLVVPGRPAATGLTWWIHSSAGRPNIHLTGPGADAATTVVHSLRRPGMPAHAGEAFVAATTGLLPDAEYRLMATLAPASASALSRTLPRSLAPLRPFTISIGSCYCPATDRGAALWSSLKVFGPDDPLRLRILSGDQIYMDLKPQSGDPLVGDRPDPWKRYPALWESPAYRPFLAACPTITLADDHEFWNDYPHSNAWLFWDENGPGGVTGRRMDQAFAVFQAALNLPPDSVVDSATAMDGLLQDQARTFTIDVGGGLSVFVLDTRCQRTLYDAARPRFATAAWLQAAVRWAEGLTAPGVLVTAQPLVRGRLSWFAKLQHKLIGGDANLPDYPDDFAALWEALFAAPHDTLVLSGDIHWSRLYQVTRASAGARQVFEFVCSPLSRIPQGAPNVGKPSGKLEWRGPAGQATWGRRWARAERQMYGTLSFIPLSDAPPGPVRVRVQLWGLPAAPGNSPPRLEVDEIVLH